MFAFLKYSLTLLVFLGLTAVAEAQVLLPPEGTPDRNSPQRRRTARRQAIVPEAEREQAGAEFVRARQEYADLLVSVLTSEELAGHVRRIAAEFRLRKAESDLDRLRQAMWEVQTSGRAEAEEGRRLAGQVAAAEAELGRLRAGVPDAPPGDWGDAAPARDILVSQLRAKMSEETDLLAATLDAGELDKRARRLHRLVGLARIAGQLRGMRQAPPQLDAGGDIPAAPKVVPAGAESPSITGNDGVSWSTPEDTTLGPATTVPPSFPD
jgi:hypothetical protein